MSTDAFLTELTEVMEDPRMIANSAAEDIRYVMLNHPEVTTPIAKRLLETYKVLKALANV